MYRGAFFLLVAVLPLKKRFDGRALSIANPGPPRSADRDENAPAIACGRSRAVAPRFGPAPIRAGRRHIRLNPGERQWRDERVNRCEDCACLPPIEVWPGLRSAGVCVCRSHDRCSVPRSAFVPTCGQTVEAEIVCSSPILAFPRTPPDVRPLHDCPTDFLPKRAPLLENARSWGHQTICSKPHAKPKAQRNQDISQTFVCARICSMTELPRIFAFRTLFQKPSQR